MGFFTKPKFGDVEGYLKKDAVIIDVRTVAEFKQGHAKGSKNIVLNTLPENLGEIKSYNKPIITCCRSGARSGSAEQFLRNEGIDVINGGPWQNVDKYIG